MTPRFAVSIDLARGRFAASAAGSRAGGCVALARGYVANAPALRAEARRRGDPPPAGEEELFALAYRWWGAQLQRHVLGEYAVAVFDERLRRAVVTHDAIGVVPLFFTLERGVLRAGSHLEDVAGADAAAPLDEDYFADLFALGRPAGGRTPYRGVRRLPPGHTLAWDGDRVREQRTWSLAETPPVRLNGVDEHAERVRELLDQAVRGATAADGPVWAELSGGLDSSTVVSVAAAGGRALPALSVIYERSASADERPWMRPVIKRYDLPWHTIDGDACPPFTDVPQPELAEPNDEIPVWALHRRYGELIERHGIATILTGHYGDLIFGGGWSEPRHLGDPLMRLDLPGFVRGVTDWQRRSPMRRSALHWAFSNGLVPAVRHLRGITPLDGVSAFGVPPWLDERWSRRMHLRERARRRHAPACETPSQQAFAEILAVVGDSAGTGRGHGDAFSFRAPLLYRPLVEFFFAAAPEHRAQPDGDRALQRAALRGILPEAIRARGGKRGAEQSFFDGLGSPASWLPLLRSGSALAERGYVDAARWRQAVETARFGVAGTMHQLVLTATIDFWLRRRDRRDAFSEITTRAPRGASDATETPVFHA
ncbi:MAG TPA: asparagine synthase-related protein [Candidatus Elarobacter sp.]|jgi:asparagine synthase (glutamine-hydrolysing)